MNKQILYSEHAVVENYPEDKLLPDYKAMDRERKEVIRVQFHVKAIAGYSCDRQYVDKDTAVPLISPQVYNDHHCIMFCRLRSCTNGSRCPSARSKSAN